MTLDLQIETLRAAYERQEMAPKDVLSALLQKAQQLLDRNAWTSLATEQQVVRQLEVATERRARGEDLPLFGIPFAVKDNIDVEGFETTAACPSFAYMPTESAVSVQRLLGAGAICLGKTNMDQFATGLVGTRSPYGACTSVFDSKYISGGSSSGSAVVVALGIVSFALGTDTAGSGRVPAAFNNIVGLKPTKGLISTRGVVPACRSLDTVSIFAGSVADALCVFDVASTGDEEDPFSRVAGRGANFDPTGTFRFGLPHDHQIETFGEDETKWSLRRAVQLLESLGGECVRIDFELFTAVANLLYSGPWVAERYAAVGGFLESDAAVPEDLDPSVSAIIREGKRWTGADTFRAQYQLEALRKKVVPLWRSMDVLLLPTVPRAYTVDEIAKDPIALNANLGRYTNFVNLLDLCGIAVPAGRKATSGCPFGVTLLAPAFSDHLVARLAARLHDRVEAKVGATTVPVRPWPNGFEVPRDEVILAVVGAHLKGQPLHGELEQLGARFVRATRTEAHYRFYALDTSPPKPGLVRSGLTEQGVYVELYALEPEPFGRFVSNVPPPLCIGTIELEDGSWVKGFLCEPAATESAEDITATGSWLAYLNEAAGRAT